MGEVECGPFFMAVGIANTPSSVEIFQAPDFMSWFHVRFFIPRVVITAFGLWTVSLRLETDMPSLRGKFTVSFGHMDGCVHPHESTKGRL